LWVRAFRRPTGPPGSCGRPRFCTIRQTQEARIAALAIKHVILRQGYLSSRRLYFHTKTERRENRFSRQQWNRTGFTFPVIVERFDYSSLMSSSPLRKHLSKIPTICPKWIRARTLRRSATHRPKALLSAKWLRLDLEVETNRTRRLCPLNGFLL